MIQAHANGTTNRSSHPGALKIQSCLVGGAAGRAAALSYHEGRMFESIGKYWWSRREQVYGMICIGIFCLALLKGFWSGQRIGMTFNSVQSDGRFYYAYLPSLLIDGDLDFENQIREHWDVSFLPAFLEDRTPTGLVRNKYPIGFALTLLPAFWVGHVIALSSGGMILADGYSWPYQIACLGWITFLFWRTLVTTDQIMTETLAITPLATLVGLGALVFGTPLVYYGFREPFMVHLVSLFWCTQVVRTASQAAPQPYTFWPWLACSAAIAVVCRPTNVFIGPVMIYGVVRLLQQAGVVRSLIWLPLASIGLIPIGLQMLAWKMLHGHWIAYSYQEEGFFWTRPALWETLISSKHGLFLWSPILCLAVLGLLSAMRQPLLWCWSLGAILLWYANSAWHCWWFGDSFGARAFLELSSLFGIGLGRFCQTYNKSLWLTITLIMLAVSYNLILMVLYITKVIPASDYWLPW